MLMRTVADWIRIRAESLFGTNRNDRETEGTRGGGKLGFGGSRAGEKVGRPKAGQVDEARSVELGYGWRCGLPLTGFGTGTTLSTY
jgi:hypothetical protein